MNSQKTQQESARSSYWHVLYVYLGNPHDSPPVKLFVPRYFDGSWFRECGFIDACEVEYDWDTKVVVPWHAVAMYKLEPLED